MRIFRSLLIVLMLAGLVDSTSAQTKELQLNDYINPKVYPQRMHNLQWRGDSDYYTYLDAKKNEHIQKAVGKARDFTAINLEMLNNAFLSIGEDSLKRMPSGAWIDYNQFRIKKANKVFIYDVKKDILVKRNEYPEKAENIDLNKKSNRIAYTLGNNLFISEEGKQTSVTADKSTEIINGQTVHRNEFGISKGTFWSPSGSLLAYYRKDESMVTDYPLVDIDTRIAEVNNTKYPMAGMNSHHVTIGVFNPKTKKTIFLKTGEPKEQFLTNVSWGPFEKYIYVAVLNRDQNHMKLNKYNAVSGDFVQTLFEEKNDRYVEPSHPLEFLKSNPDQFIWQSRKDGFNHLYLYNSKGEQLKQITKGDWLVNEVIGFGPKDKFIVFTSTKNSPLNQDVFKVDVKTGEITEISYHGGQHSPILNPNGEYIIDAFSSIEIAREYAVVDIKGKKRRNILTDKDPMSEYTLGDMDIFTIKSEDNTDLYCRMIKPYNFDSTKSYPVLIYVYGGPHAQLITNSFLGGAGLFLNYMANQGYIVFTLDNHGSANRGYEFESIIHRNVGTIEVRDQMKGVEYLKSLTYVDTTRIGVDGWSYGGFMTISMMLKHPGTFKAACAGGPVIDWKYYEIMYGERYMDRPEENPEGYKNASLLNYVKDLEGRLLVIHGTEDPVVLWQHSLALLQQSVKDQKLIDYYVYPGHEHNVRGKDRIHLFMKIEQYFKDHLME
ncbi:MAG: DPP IV N-terminal domain-containing protein [Bacteroidales bacterium]|nr:DPP IV N-terminal domain-containing protein [Bacteroidales bacterium]